MSSDPPDGAPSGEDVPKALASSRTESADVYEARFMQSGGRALHRDKSVLRWHWVMLLFALATLAGAIFIAMGLDPNASPGWAAVPGLGALVFGFCWVALTVVRSVVTERELYVQYGLWGPRIPIDAIESAEVIDYDSAEYGGWGIKRHADGVWAYITTGGDVVKVHYVHPETGKKTAVVFSAEDPHGVVGSIRRARVAQSSRLRIEATEGPAIEQRSEAEEALGVEEAAELEKEARRALDS